MLEWDRSLFDLIRRGSHLAFDYELYRTLTPAMRRFYLIANRDGWRQRDSSIFIADDFAMNQIGYTERPEFRAQRMQKLKRLLADAATGKSIEIDSVTERRVRRMVSWRDGRGGRARGGRASASLP